MKIFINSELIRHNSRHPHLRSEMKAPTRLPYHDFVHTLRPQWHQLRHLDDFMSNPNLHGFQVAVLDFDDSEGVMKKEFNEIGKLSEFLDCVVEKTKSRLLVVEDPSTNLIEMLGSRYDIDPEFFSMHVVNHHWYGMCSSLETIPSSKGTIQEQSFLRLRYVEARLVEDVNQNRAAHGHRKSWHVRCTPLRNDLHKSPIDPSNEWTNSYMVGPNSNVHRKVSVMNLISAHKPIGLARHHLTTWMKSTGPGCWIGMCVFRIF